MTLVLGVETSCDETSVAIVEGAGDDVQLRSLVILSQDVHRVFGGVVPELASRAHLTAIEPVLRSALAEARVQLPALDVVAVTVGPGLVGALLVGMSFGKALAYALERPLVGVHHMEGHLFATSLEHPDAVPPFTALLVSGGHTMLVDVEAWGRYRVLGRTRDDAAGEAFDKVAKLLDLPYPGGPHLERLARDGTHGAVRFPRPMLRRDQQPGDSDYFDVSFSGLKTAVLNLRHSSQKSGAEWKPADVALGFQEALVGTLVEKTARAVEQYARQRVVLGGGVAGNLALVDAMRERMAALGVRVYAPSGRLATDNAAMIARAGLFHFENGHRAGLDLNAYASLPLPGVIA
ncbi:MAG TPA: tRNA (adenosine(37)-N6)-threonylcarbamoyltransferase complex transferase subunit TsaD [Gemmatimonadaceae bacterium]|nr:tRNA (adenosine(37)-N6)-threonylcarbamoyltransferase complex transferase subunit TsaD [Gemmatimonadaceae bacterium]